MNILLIVIIGGLVVGLVPRLPRRWVAPVLLAVSVAVTGLFLLSSRGR
jgi:hypothetical protein